MYCSGFSTMVALSELKTAYSVLGTNGGGLKFFILRGSSHASRACAFAAVLFRSSNKMVSSLSLSIVTAA